MIVLVILKKNYLKHNYQSNSRESTSYPTNKIYNPYNILMKAMTIIKELSFYYVLGLLALVTGSLYIAI